MGKKKSASVPHQVARQHMPAIANESTYKVPAYAIVLVLLVTAVVYSSALQNGITYIDDDMYLLKNPFLRDFSFKGVKAIFSSFYEFNYHPLTTLVWLLEFKLFGLNPLPYHSFNVLVHLANILLVYTLARRLSGKDVTGLVVAILFAVHPLHVESVAWISEMKGLLCGLFYFLSLIYYLKYVDGGFKKKDLVAVLLLFVAALLSKSAAVTLPFVMLVIDIYRGRKITIGVALEKAPFIVLSILFGVLAIMSQRSGGAVTDITEIYGFTNRVLIFTSGLAFYFVKAVVPFHLSAIHYFPNLDGDMLAWPYYASVPFLFFVAWLVYRKSAMKRETVFGVFFFLAVICVMLQVVPVGLAYAAERYTYVSYFGLFYIAGQWLSGISAENRVRTTVIFVLVTLAFSVQSWSRVAVWKDTETVFTDLVEKNEGNRNNYLVYFHWGDYYQAEGKLKEAQEKYNECVELKPDFERAYIKRGETNDAMGNIIAAIMDANEAIRLNPKSAIAYNNKGWAYHELGDKILSVANLDTAIFLDPKMANAYNNRGWVRLQRGDSASAMQDFTSAIREAPAFPKPYYNRALVEYYSGNIKEAIKDYTDLLAIYPHDAQAYYYRGLSYVKIKDNVAAKRDFVKAAELGSRDAESALRELGK